MKRIVIVNNNMKVGGVQKSLYNLLWSIAGQYDITLYLFSKTGAYIDELPESVKIVSCPSLFRYLGVSQGECHNRLHDRLIRGSLAALCKIFGRPFVIRLISLSQKTLSEEYDVAISYLHNGNIKSFYGGVNEFVLTKIKAKRKIAYLHCDYCNCGANNRKNNKIYLNFDLIAACSDGCRKSFLAAIPELKDKCMTAPNFHRYHLIRALAQESPITYEPGRFNLLVVGRLAHEKAVDRAIRAVAHGINHGIAISLYVVGDGNRMDSIKQLASELSIQDHVHFCGEQPNPYRYMKNADLLLVTSYHEAAPMVIDEARAIGLPVLTVETTSSKEMVTDSNAGWVCENTQQALNESLVQILTDISVLEQVKTRLAAAKPENLVAMERFQLMIGEHNED
ncbi:glycosyltransferase [Pseudoflavonifractor sp. P01025]|uniref:glycosyltransferase n=1 Tax=Flintibacter porci TaxID=3342383 RepID=UPI0035B640E1